MTPNRGISRVEWSGSQAKSMPTSLDRIEELGIVGAGGGGFPTAVKLKTQVSLLIANAAECEPLLHKDKELLLHHSEPFLRGMRWRWNWWARSEGVIGIKEKYHDIIAALEAQVPAGVRVMALPDVYPAGDEFILVHMVTGRVIPPGGLPKDVDAAVCNVETLMNIGLDQPVTHKYLTVAGAVADACHAASSSWHHHRRSDRSGRRTDGIRFRGAAGRRDDGASPAESLDVPVTKTTGGIVVLPTEHSSDSTA